MGHPNIGTEHLLLGLAQETLFISASTEIKNSANNGQFTRRKMTQAAIPTIAAGTPDLIAAP